MEDNDDLIPLFKEMSGSLRQNYGQYFVAEFVKNQTEHRRCLVAEVGMVGVVVMSVVVISVVVVMSVVIVVEICLV